MSSVKEFTRILTRLIPAIKRSAVIMFCASVVYEAIKFIPVYLLKLIVDDIFATPNVSYLLLLVAGVFVSLMVLLFIDVKTTTWIARTSAKQQETIMRESFSKVTELPLSWHEDQNTGSLVSKITKASNHVGSLIWFLNNDLIPSSTQIMLTAAMLTWVDWRIGLIYIVFTPIMLYMIDYQFKKVQPYREQYHGAYEDATNELAQTLYNIQTVQNYTQEDKEQHKQQQSLNEFLQGINKRTKYEFKAILSRDGLTNIVRVSTLAIAVWLVSQNQITPGDLVLVFTLTEKAYINLFRLGRIYSFMGDSHEALARALKIKETPTKTSKSTQEFVNGDIQLHDVEFSYENTYALTNINATIQQNQTTALVGPSGSGKTTLVRLLMRHYEPSKGSITLNGVNIQDMSIQDLREHIAFVSQETQLFDRTIHENIAYAKHATRKEVIQAAKQANAHEFIQQLTHGYDTKIGEQGVKLSGGQRQRISIARALIADTPIIIFDEATSSLDSESEKAIQDALHSITNKTLIIIAHRLSTIEQADHILVLEHGKLIEEGNHKELTRHEGLYARMQQLQQLGELRN
jgi:ABC-type multidrug transport system fused ATPase/permease subunit